MSNINIKALRELEAKATPGPWKWAVGEGDPQIEGNLEYPESSPVLVARGCGNKKASEAGVLGCMPEKLGDPLRACPMHPCGIDRELIVALRNSFPALLNEIELLREQLEDADHLASLSGALADKLQERHSENSRLKAENKSLKAEIERLRAENERLRALLPAAWDAGAARMLASHKEFKQTHPTRSEWLNEALRGGDA